MTLDDLPLVEHVLTIGGRAYRIAASADQDSLLRSTAARDLLPLGLMLWESAVVLAETVAHSLAPQRVLNVLELGCGVGLAGLVAAARGAAVVQTDIDPLALDLAAQNVARNGLGNRVMQEVADWRTWQPLVRYDLILGADILYDRDDHASVLRVMRAALAPGGHVLLSDPTRPDTAQFIAQLHADGWATDVTRHTTADLTRPGRTVDVQVIACRRNV